MSYIKMYTIFNIIMVIILPGFKVVRCDDNKADCKTLENDSSVLLKMIKLEESVSNQEKIIKELREEIKDNRRAFSKHSSGGSTYIRWGRTTCPRGSTEVYQGYTAGSFYLHSGGAARPLCLTTKPTWGYYTTNEESGAFIYGTEYETSEYSRWKYLHNQDVPCIVCRATYNDVLMVPGTKYCPKSYTLQYNGYLMAGKYSHTVATEYICVDGNPGRMERGYENKDGFLLYFVQAKCGSLPCGPYIKHRELTCAVCSFSTSFKK